jgi:diguanylate cyclase (GGDEF)-like protein/PAS domain S-box-containing protein
MPYFPSQRHLLDALLESIEDAVLSISLDGTIESWSSGAERLYGYTEKEIVGEPLRRLVPVYELAATERFLERAKHGELRLQDATERLRKNGLKIRIEVRRVAARNEQGETTGVLEWAKELSWRKSDVTKAEQIRLMAQQMPGVMWTTDLDLKITSIWGSGLAELMIAPKQLLGRSVCELLGSGDGHATPILEHQEALRGTRSHFEYQRRGQFFEMHVGALRSASGAIIGCIGVGSDITERKKTEDENHYQARHDALTGLANYRQFIDSLEQETRRAERSRQCFTVLLLDLDGLKKINDQYGHLTGNRALKRLVAVMKEQCRATDLAARYGGDEFAALLIDSDSGMAEHVSQRIRNCLGGDGETPKLSVSIGIAVHPQDGRTAHDLLEAADQQLYQRKKLLKLRSVSAT